ncbi:hypothetical protein J2X72_003011 [Phyllobacterium sp. 1468]|nr:hypothetical protein [Phyllobacterium sp. 1468]
MPIAKPQTGPQREARNRGYEVVQDKPDPLYDEPTSPAETEQIAGWLEAGHQAVRSKT